MSAVLLGMNRCGSFSLFSEPSLPLASEQTLKDLIQNSHGQHKILNTQPFLLCYHSLRTFPSLITLLGL